MGCSYFTSSEPMPWNNTIEVIKGSPAKAKYAIFYAVEADPVIFCNTYRSMTTALAKLKKRRDVDQKSIRVFKLWSK